jgi:hypothetical protein
MTARPPTGPPAQLLLPGSGATEHVVLMLEPSNDVPVQRTSRSKVGSVGSHDADGDATLSR